jgi:hypothetical protein
MAKVTHVDGPTYSTVWPLYCLTQILQKIEKIIGVAAGSL